MEALFVVISSLRRNAVLVMQFCALFVLVRAAVVRVGLAASSNEHDPQHGNSAFRGYILLEQLKWMAHCSVRWTSVT